MKGWESDPELVATFRAEVDERLASLRDGLLRLEEHPSPRQAVVGLFRDAHTVKGSARMLGLDDVVAIAHRAEDVLGAIRDGRLVPRREVVDALLAACEAVAAGLPGAGPRGPASQRDAPARAVVVAALDAALAQGPAPAALSSAPAAAVSARPGQAAPALPTTAAAALPTQTTPSPSGPTTIRVPVRRVHGLLDQVGEAELAGRRVERQVDLVEDAADAHAVRTRALRDALRQDGASLSPEVTLALSQLLAGGEELVAATQALAATTEDLRGGLEVVRDDAMALAMAPVSRVVAAFPALVRDVARRTGKDVGLVLRGEDVELDSRVLDGVADALRHLVINAVDHGCEPAEARTARGKPPRASVVVTARAAGSTVVVEVADDGAGIDEERLRARAIATGLLDADAPASSGSLYRLLFRAGFSTRNEVSETSGRGVGLDVVATAVDDLGGSVEVTSVPGAGTKVTITLPVTLGVLRCVLARVGDERYALPVTGVVETVSLAECPPAQLAGSTVLVRHGRTVPLLDLGEVLGVASAGPARAAVVSSSGGGEQLAWSVDALEGEAELVVKDLGGFLGRLPTLAGATVDGDGRVLLLLDLRELGCSPRAASVSSASSPSPRVAGGRVRGAIGAVAPAGPSAARPRVLVVEDSLGVRELERAILESAGYDVVACVDGLDGAAHLAEPPVDLVLSDVEMPGMDGLTLTRTLRRTRGWEQVPVVIMTSRDDAEDRRAGLEAGADAYLLKGNFDQVQLVDTVRRLVGR